MNEEDIKLQRQINELHDELDEVRYLVLKKTGQNPYKTVAEIVEGSTIVDTPIKDIPNNTSTDISILDLTHDLVFSVTDKDTVAWATGTITISNGRTFAIDAGNTGNMAARTYIYLDTAVSSTVLQATTTVSTAMGANKKLIAVAQNGAAQAQFIVYGGIGGIKLPASGTSISNNNWTFSGTWSVTDADTIAWGAGTLSTSDGGAYSITGSDTGNMAAKTYIYFDLAVSSTAFQTTTTAANAIGDGKILIAIAQNGTGEGTYLVMNDKQSNLDAAQIVAGSITANEIAAGAVTAVKVSVSQLSAITADMGAITAGTIVMPSGGLIRSGQTAYNTGTGFYLGNDSGTPKFSIGNPATKYLTWDGSDLTVNGYVANSKGVFGGDGADGALSISSGTTNIDLGSAAVVIKNYTSISITGTAAITFTNPHAYGTIVIFKSQGNVTITTSATRAIDLRSIGGTGGSTSGAGSGGEIGYYGNGTPTISGGGLGGTIAATPGGLGGAVGSSLGATALLFLKSITVGCGAGGGQGGGSGGAPTYQSGGGGAGGSSIKSAGTAGSNATISTGTGQAGGDGGRGGGAFYLECKGAYSCSGTIDASGATGTNGDATGDAGGGGGGGGGVIAILYNTLTSDTGTYTITAGSGGSPSGAGGAGGAGATGVSLRQINSQFA